MLGLRCAVAGCAADAIRPMTQLRVTHRRARFLRTPLFRLLAINLAIGAGLAVLLVGGLLLLNPGGLRHLIFADRSPGTALGLLLFGFIVTIGSTAMGTAIMAAGQPPANHRGPRGGKGHLLPQEIARAARS